MKIRILILALLLYTISSCKQETSSKKVHNANLTKSSLIENELEESKTIEIVEKLFSKIDQLFS